jgi:site-specific DNA-cytosine methylase
MPAAGEALGDGVPNPEAVPNLEALPYLDLFSGIGGFALGLADLMRPVAYCDIDPNARAVLSARIRDGSLPAAPVLGDVRYLTLDTLPRPHRRGRISICAGFPCVGFSMAGKRDGFAQPQSALFAEVLRLVDLLRPPLVFLENVAAILTMGIGSVVTDLTARGYQLRWTVLTGFDVGSPQQRARWFCLALRDNGLAFTAQTTLRDTGVLRSRAWRAARLADRAECSMTSAQQARRVGMLGNAVVPQAVRRAFDILASGFDTRLATTGVDNAAAAGSASTNMLPKPGLDLCLKGKTAWPLHGAVVGKQLYTPLQGYRQHTTAAPASAAIELLPASFHPRAPPSTHQTAEQVSTPLRKPAWATPRTSAPRSSNYLTLRGSRDLGTQVRFERHTLPGQRGCRLSPRFVEWLMGFPRDWTKA